MKKVKVIILTHQDPAKCKSVYEMSLRLGYHWEYYRGEPSAGIRLNQDGKCSYSSSGDSYISAYQDYPRLDAFTQWNQVLYLLGKAPQFMRNCIIKTNKNLAQSKAVIKLAVKAGYDQLNEGAHSSIVCGEWFSGINKMQLLQGDYNGNIERHPDWPRFDSATDMDKIKLFFEGKLDIPVTIENFVMPKLLELIRNNPADELTFGFIRRDLGLALPPEVQDQGPDAICAWILEQKKSQQPTVSSEAHNSKVNKFRITLDYYVDQSVTRTDRIDYEGVVPQEVVGRAIAEGDYQIIESWLVENRASLTQLNIHEGDSDYGDEHSRFSEVTDPEYTNHSVEDQFDEMVGN